MSTRWRPDSVSSASVSGVGTRGSRPPAKPSDSSPADPAGLFHVQPSRNIPMLSAAFPSAGPKDDPGLCPHCPGHSPWMPEASQNVAGGRAKRHHRNRPKECPRTPEGCQPLPSHSPDPEPTHRFPPPPGTERGCIRRITRSNPRPPTVPIRSSAPSSSPPVASTGHAAGPAALRAGSTLDEKDQRQDAAATVGRTERGCIRRITRSNPRPPIVPIRSYKPSSSPPVASTGHAAGPAALRAASALGEGDQRQDAAAMSNAYSSGSSLGHRRDSS